MAGPPVRSIALPARDRSGAARPRSPRATKSRASFWLRLVSIVCIAILLVGVGATTSTRAQEADIHIVGPGETLTTIARRYSVDAGALARYNGLPNPNLIRSGQPLRIPNRQRSSPGPTPATVWVPSVRATLGPANPVAVPPSPTPSPTCPLRIHTVRPLETLAVIAAYYGVSVGALAEVNRLTGDRIRSGQKLLVLC